MTHAAARILLALSALLALPACNPDAGPGDADTGSTAGADSSGSTSADEPTGTGAPATGETSAPDTSTGAPADTTAADSTGPGETSTSSAETTTGAADTTSGETGGEPGPVEQVCMDFCAAYFECFPDNDSFPSVAACTQDCSTEWATQIAAAGDPAACEAAILAFQGCATSVLCDGTPQDCPEEFMQYQTAC